MREYVIGSDNAGFALKAVLMETLDQMGYTVEDAGCFDDSSTEYYPLIAQRVCRKIIDSNYEKRGILICGTGLGMAISANKFRGIRAGVCHDNYSAERLILSNNGNVLCMGQRVIGTELAKKILKEWVTLEFEDGSSTPKVEVISAIEDECMKKQTAGKGALHS